MPFLGKRFHRFPYAASALSPFARETLYLISRRRSLEMTFIVESVFGDSFIDHTCQPASCLELHYSSNRSNHLIIGLWKVSPEYGLTELRKPVHQHWP